MARFAVGLVFGVVVGVVAGAAAGLHADPADQDVHEAAVAAGVDEQDLKGALASLEVAGKPADPYSYLRSTGELPSLPPSVAASPPAPTSGVFSALAQCESSGIWARNSGNGYYGGLQEDMTFWVRYGGLAYAPRPDLASPAAQTAVAQRGLSVQGFAAWPSCSRRLGLR